MNSEHSRYFRTVRRSQTTTRARVSGTALAAAMLVLPLACGTGDEAAFATTTDVEPSAQTSPAATTAPLDPATTVPATGAPQATAIQGTSATALAAPSGVFPSGAEIVVSFSYEPSGANNPKRPYIAVWVEDRSGNLVDTISLWFEQGGKGTKWLNDLAQWYNTSGGDDTTMSGATRVAGEYTVAWDGTDAAGNPVDVGDYVLHIESAREHGPTSYTTGSITISDSAFSVGLSDDGELRGSTVALHL